MTRQETPGEQAIFRPQKAKTRRFRRIAKLRRSARRVAGLAPQAMQVGAQDQGSRVRRREAARTGLEAGRNPPTRSTPSRFLVFRVGLVSPGVEGRKLLCVVHSSPKARFGWGEGARATGSDSSRDRSSGRPGGSGRTPSGCRKAMKVKALEGQKSRRAAAVRRGATRVVRERIRKRNDKLRSR